MSDCDTKLVDDSKCSMAIGDCNIVGTVDGAAVDEIHERDRRRLRPLDSPCVTIWGACGAH